MNNDAFAALLFLASFPIGMAGGIVGVWLVRSGVVWWMTP